VGREKILDMVVAMQYKEEMCCCYTICTG